LGLGIYFNTIIVEFGEMLGYFIGFLVIDKICRKKWLMITFGATSLLSLLDVFIKVPE